MKPNEWLPYAAALLTGAMGIWAGRRTKNVEAAKAETDVIKQLQGDIGKWADSVQAMSLKFAEAELRYSADIAALRLENAMLKADVQILKHENESLQARLSQLGN